MVLRVASVMKGLGASSIGLQATLNEHHSCSFKYSTLPWLSPIS
jgi:hypothetical protein